MDIHFRKYKIVWVILLLVFVTFVGAISDTLTSDFSSGVNIDNINVSGDELKINSSTILFRYDDDSDFSSGTNTNLNINSFGHIALEPIDGEVFATNTTLKRAPASSYGNFHLLSISSLSSNQYILNASVYGDGGTDTFGSIALMNPSGQSFSLGTWSPTEVTSSIPDSPIILSFNITNYVNETGDYRVTWTYTGGNRGLFIKSETIYGNVYSTSGNFLSGIIDGSEDSMWESVNWQVSKEEGQNATLKIRTGNYSTYPSFDSCLIGNWSSSTITSSDPDYPVSLSFNVTNCIQGAGVYNVTWDYESGERALIITTSRILGDGMVISTDATARKAPEGAGYGNEDTLIIATDNASEYLVTAEAYGLGGTDTFGSIYIQLLTSYEWNNWSSPSDTNISVNETYKTGRYLQYFVNLTSDSFLSTPLIHSLFLNSSRTSGVFESKVIDSEFDANWKNLTWTGIFPEGSNTTFWISNSTDNLVWSGWQGPYSNSTYSSLEGISGRYIKYKTKLEQGDSSPLIFDVNLEYFNSNLVISDLVDKDAGESVIIWANYTSVPNYSPITGATCLVSGDMEGVLLWNSSSLRYEKEFSLSSIGGNEDYTVSCSSNNYDNLNLIDNYVINLDYSISVCTWKDCSLGAVSHTFDDTRSAFFDSFMPVFDSRGIHMTIFIITSWVTEGGVSWSDLISAVSNGHEMASHTVNHVTPTFDEANLSRFYLDGNLTNQKALTLAYPGSVCPPDAQLNVENAGYIAARCWKDEPSPNPSTPTNWFELYSNDSRDVYNLADYYSWIDIAESSGGWYIFMHHDNTINATELGAILDYGITKDVWVETMREVSKYIYERDNITFSNLQESLSNIRFNASVNLDESTFDEPLTIKAIIPSEMKIKNVSVDGVGVNWSYETKSGDDYFRFNSVITNNSEVVAFIDKTNPSITSANFLNNSAVSTANYNFTFSVSDDSFVENCSIYYDDAFVVNQTANNKTRSLNQLFQDVELGSHRIDLICYDNYTHSKTYTHHFKKINLGGLTTSVDLALVDITSVASFSINSSHGDILFYDSVDISDISNFSQGISISSNRIELNSSLFPSLNRSAKLRFKGLTFSNPQILKDGVVCSSPTCNIISYSGGVLTFNVTSFSVYTSSESETSEEPSSDSPSSSGLSGYYISELQLKEGFTSNFLSWRGVRINLEGKNSFIYIRGINSTSVEFSFLNDNYNLFMGDISTLDLNDDGNSDIIIKLNSISSSNSANMSFYYFSEEVLSELGNNLEDGSFEEEDISEENRDNDRLGRNSLIYIWLLGLLIIVIICVLLLRKKIMKAFKSRRRQLRLRGDKKKK